LDIRRQLEWVSRNRSRKSRTKSVGAAVSEFAANLAADIEPLEAAADALGGLVDDEFRRHCVVGGWHHGVLTICVREPAMISVMRMKWSSRIKCELPRLLSRGITRVVFAPGASGTPVSKESPD